jgi:hypothetical protein
MYPQLLEVLNTVGQVVGCILNNLDDIGSGWTYIIDGGKFAPPAPSPGALF